MSAILSQPASIDVAAVKGGKENYKLRGRFTTTKLLSHNMTFVFYRRPISQRVYELIIQILWKLFLF